ncbi:MAG: hypothetical protein RIT17_506 [Pseudomonadota bacterium]
MRSLRQTRDPASVSWLRFLQRYRLEPLGITPLEMPSLSGRLQAGGPSWNLRISRSVRGMAQGPAWGRHLADPNFSETG